MKIYNQEKTDSSFVYCKNITIFSSKSTFLKEKENANTMISVVNALVKKYKGVTKEVRTEYKLWIKTNAANLSGGELAYSLIDDNGAIYQPVHLWLLLINPKLVLIGHLSIP